MENFPNLKATIYDPVAWAHMFKQVTASNSCGHLLEALKALPFSPVKAARMGMVYNRMDQPKKAMRCVQKYLDDDLCYAVYVMLKAQSKTPAEWQEVLDTLSPRPIDPLIFVYQMEANSIIHFNRGICAVNLCNEAVAEVEFQEAEKLADSLRDQSRKDSILLERARLNRLLGKYKEAWESLSELQARSQHAFLLLHVAESLIWCSYLTASRLPKGTPAWAVDALNSLNALKAVAPPEDLYLKDVFTTAQVLEHLRGLYVWWWKNLSLLNVDERSTELERLVSRVLNCKPAGRDQYSAFFTSIAHGLAMSIAGKKEGLVDILATLDRPVDHDPLMRLVWCASVIQANANLPQHPELLAFDISRCVNEMKEKLLTLPGGQILFLSRWMRLFAPSALVLLSDEMDHSLLKMELANVVRVKATGAYLGGMKVQKFPVQLFNRWILRFLNQHSTSNAGLKCSGTELRQAYRIQSLHAIEELSVAFETVIHTMYNKKENMRMGA